MADTQIDRRVEIGVVEFLDHVRTDDAHLRRAVGDKSRHIEGAHADQAHIGTQAGKGQCAAFGIVEFRIRLNTCARHHGQRLIKNAPLGDSEGKLSGIVVDTDGGHDRPRT